MIERITLRLPSELHKRLKEIANKSERSLNGQIVFILKEWVKAHDAEL